jgi:HEAT repeat protein
VETCRFCQVHLQIERTVENHRLGAVVSRIGVSNAENQTRMHNQHPHEGQSKLGPCPGQRRSAHHPWWNILQLALVLVGLLCAFGLLRFQGVEARHDGKPLSWWLEELVRPEQDRVRAASAALVNMGPEAVPVLARAVGRRDSWLKSWMHRELAKVKPFDAPWVPAAHYRLRALEVLAGMGPEAKAALPSVTALLQYGAATQEEVRIHAILVGIGCEVIPELVPILQRTTHAQPFRVVLSAWDELLGDITLEPEVLSFVRTEAIRGLSSVDARVVIAATRVLARLGTEADAAIPELVQVLRKPGWAVGVVAESVVFALGRIKGDPGRVIPVLTECLETGDARLRIEAAKALGMFGCSAEAAVAALTRALWSPDDEAFASVADALGRIGAGAQESGPALMQGLGHEQPFIRALAAISLTRVQADPEMLVPALARALGDPDPYVRGRLAWALGELGAAAAPAVDRLAETLWDQDESVQVAAIEALGAIGTQALPAVPHLHRARSNKQSGLGRHVLAALARIELKTDD